MTDEEPDGRVCSNPDCGYRDPSACAMTCPSCDTPYADVGVRPE